MDSLGIGNIPNNIAPNQNEIAPTKGSGSSRKGYFDWKTHKTTENEVIGCILPPTPTWLQERIAAAQSQQMFSTPFGIGHGLHAVGFGNKGKVYTECLNSLIYLNKVGDDTPLLPPELQNADQDCPLCHAAWDEIWPQVERYKGQKESAEYKTFKSAHKIATPQRKFIFNFLPMGSAEPLLFDAPMTLWEQIKDLHYDVRQPDLLMPVSPNNQWQNAWVHIKRVVRPDTTDYTISPIYTNTPFVQNANREFDEATYIAIMNKARDLREVAMELYQDYQKNHGKAMEKLCNSVNFSLSAHKQVAERIEIATSPVAGQPMAQPPVAGQPMAQPPVAQPPVAQPPTQPQQIDTQPQQIDTQPQQIDTQPQPQIMAQPPAQPPTQPQPQIMAQPPAQPQQIDTQPQPQIMAQPAAVTPANPAPAQPNGDSQQTLTMLQSLMNPPSTK